MYPVCDGLPADFLTFEGRVACFAGYEVCKAVVIATEITIAQCELQDALVDGAEIEAAYENSKILSEQVTTHDTNIDGDLSAHDTNIDGDLIAHDTNLTNRANAIDAAIAIIEAKADALADQVAVVQYTLDTEIEKMRVHLQVIEIKEKERFLVMSTEAGLPVDVELIGLQVAESSPNGPIAFLDVLSEATATPVKTGILDVTIDLPGPAQNAKIFEFTVRHDHGADPAHFGTIVVQRVDENNLGSGQ